MHRDDAEALALRALAWLAEDRGRLGAFLAETGAGPDDLRRGAGDPALLAAVLDFVLGADARVTGLAAALGLPPGQVAAARAALPGGTDPHWT